MRNRNGNVKHNCWARPCRGSKKLPFRTKFVDPDNNFDACEYVDVLIKKKTKLVKSLARWVKEENVQAGDEFPEYAVNVNDQIKKLQREISFIREEYSEAFE